MMDKSSDYLLHKDKNKNILYKNNKSLWWSPELNRWMCTNPDIIRLILNDANYAVHDYKIDTILERFNFELQHVAKLVAYFPIAKNGEAHKAIRKRSAVEILKNSDAALEAFTTTLDSKMKLLFGNQSADIVKDILKPSLIASLLVLSGIHNLAPSISFDSLSQILDETTSLNKRIKINKIIAEILNALPEDMSDDDKYFRISLLALGSDSLIGTITESVAYILSKNQDKLCSDIAWDSEIPSTGVPVIERMSINDNLMGGVNVLSGQRVRLYLDSAGYQQSELPSYAQIYFATGVHTCLGMPIGRKIWDIVKSRFEKVHKKLIISNMEYRTPDNVFNIYESIKVGIYD
jgi:hypothetical protein